MNTPQNPMALSGLTDKPMKKPSPCPLPTILHRLAETLRLDSAYPRVLWLSLLVFMAALCADTARAQNTRPMSMDLAKPLRLRPNTQSPPPQCAFPSEPNAPALPGMTKSE